MIGCEAGSVTSHMTIFRLGDSASRHLYVFSMGNGRRFVGRLSLLFGVHDSDSSGWQHEMNSGKCIITGVMFLDAEIRQFQRQTLAYRISV